MAETAVDRVTLENGKYSVELNNGLMKFYRHGQPWEAGQKHFEYSGFVSSMLHRIIELEAAAEAARQEEREATTDLLQGCLVTLQRARVFVTSRERIKKPEGEELYDEFIAELKAAIRARKP